MIRNWYNQIPHPALKTKREITKFINWQYRVYWNRAAAAYSSLYFFIFLSLQFSNIKIFLHTFLRNCEAQKIKTWYTYGQWVDVQCIVYSGIGLLLLIHPFISSFCFLSNFQTLKFFVTLFSGTVKPRRLKLGTNLDSGHMYHVKWNQAAAVYSSLYIFIFLSLQISSIKIFCHTFLRNCEVYKVDTRVDNEWMYRVYSNQAAASYFFFISSFFFLSSVQKILVFVTLFSGTVRPRKFGTLVSNGWM